MIKYKCEDCGKVFNTPLHSIEKEKLGDYYDEHIVARCPHCNGTDLKEGVECVCCEENIAEDGNALCKRCNNWLVSEIDELAREYGISRDELIEEISNVE